MGQSRGRNCLKNGKQQEETIRNRLQQLKQEKFDIVCDEKTSGSQITPDITFQLKGNIYKIEIKTKRAFEAGGRAFQYKDEQLIMEDPFFRSLLPKNYVPFEGKIPSFKKGDKSLETWSREKQNFKEERIVLDDLDQVALQQKAQGSSYIQIEGYGLYHTGEDVLDLDVPMFTCKVTLRVRCKQHGKTSLPGSVQASINQNKKQLSKSCYDLDTNLPPKLTVG